MEFIICHKDMSTEDAISHIDLDKVQASTKNFITNASNKAHAYIDKMIGKNGKIRYIYDRYRFKKGAKGLAKKASNFIKDTFYTKGLNNRNMSKSRKQGIKTVKNLAKNTSKFIKDTFYTKGLNDRTKAYKKDVRKGRKAIKKVLFG